MAPNLTVEEDSQDQRDRIIDKNGIADTKDSTAAVMPEEVEKLERAEILRVLNFLQCMENTGNSY